MSGISMSFGKDAVKGATGKEAKQEVKFETFRHSWWAENRFSSAIKTELLSNPN